MYFIVVFRSMCRSFCRKKTQIFHGTYSNLTSFFSGRKILNMPFAYFHSINVKKNWVHLAVKNLQPGVKITAIFTLSLKCSKRIIIKTF